MARANHFDDKFRQKRSLEARKVPNRLVPCQCTGCGWEPDLEQPMPKRCIKCGSHSFEKITARRF